MKQLIILTAILLTSFFGFSQTRELDSLTIQLTFEKRDSTKVDTSIKLIKMLFDNKEFKKALLYINRSEQLSYDLNYDAALAEIKYLKALIYTKNSDYYNAIDNYKRSLSLYVSLKDTLGIAKVNNSLGSVEIARGNYAIGLQYALYAIDIFERKNQLDELSQAYRNLAIAFKNTHQNDKALDYNYKALQVFKLTENNEGIKMTHLDLAQLYALRNEHRKAIEFYKKVLIDLTSNGDDLILKGNVLPSIASQYLKFKEYDKATSFLLEGIKLNRAQKNKKGLLKTLNNLSNLNLQLKKIRLAQYQLEEAFLLTKEVQSDTLLLDHYSIRIQLDSTRGDFKNAFIWQGRHHALKSKLESAKSLKNALITEGIKPINLVLPAVETYNNSDSINQQTFDRFKYLIFGLGGILLIIFSVLLGVFSKQKSLRNKKKVTDETNRQSKIENNKLRNQVEHLEEMNQVKDRLFSIVSHDLKDSITGVKAFLDLLREDSITREEFDELIPELSENADNATNLLLNLLNWSKSQMQNLDPKPEQFNIQDVFHEKMNLVEKKANQKNIILLNESTKAAVFADRSMIEIVIQNLLANAVKFSRVGDVITVSNRQRNGNTLICIEDTGVGISKENQKKLFLNAGFTTRGTNHEKGTGLGLSIAKHLIEQNNGKIWVESESNLGSKFFIELPND
jgi:two-component system, sensor histidine kinase and response regulator